MQLPPRYTEIELPHWRCLPAHVAAADQARLKPVVASVPARLGLQEVPDSAAFRFGIDLFNSGFFWEAHEVWEPVWMALPPNSAERTACRSLIQGANACLKLRYGWNNAFSKLVREVERLVRDATLQDACVAGIALDQWAVAFRAFADRLEAGQEVAMGFAPLDVAKFPFLLMTPR